MPLSTAIGLRVKDGVVLAVEKLIHSKLLVPGANRRIQTIERHIGMVKFLVFIPHRSLYPQHLGYRRTPCGRSQYLKQGTRRMCTRSQCHERTTHRQGMHRRVLP